MICELVSFYHGLHESSRMGLDSSKNGENTSGQRCGEVKLLVRILI